MLLFVLVGRGLKKRRDSWSMTWLRSVKLASALALVLSAFAVGAREMRIAIGWRPVSVARHCSLSCPEDLMCFSRNASFSLVCPTINPPLCTHSGCYLTAPSTRRKKWMSICERPIVTFSFEQLYWTENVRWKNATDYNIEPYHPLPPTIVWEDPVGKGTVQMSLRENLSHWWPPFRIDGFYPSARV